MKITDLKVFSGVAKTIPLWMYFVECLLNVFCGIVNIPLLVFGQRCILNYEWTGYMLDHVG